MSPLSWKVSIATTDEVIVVIFFDRVTRVLFGCSADEFFHFCRLHPFAAEKAAEVLEGEMCRLTLSKPKSSNAQHLRAASVVPLRTGFRPVIDTLKQMICQLLAISCRFLVASNEKCLRNDLFNKPQRLVGIR
ncbi:uncharacterized protein A4U43_C10F15420 [Asparagus officinalis]|uniref:Uncharacterized protein n=1 Tax=Asparagus officinalis TaxID=4686 RepID=A0A5P1E2Y4_ASPOF|nr:uncharacterized protein A4U43_C10F15420 [Asparagus officinalis]